MRAVGLILGLLSFASTVAVADEDPVRVSGFVDVLYKMNSSQSNETGPSIHDGAIYIKKSLEQGDVVVDLPFKNGANGNNFNFATEKAQAYISAKYKCGCRWKVGQFDAVYGFESADSSERRFAMAGLVSGLLPTTHTGFWVGHDFQDHLGLSFFAANPNGAGTPSGDNFEYGSHLAYSGAQWRGSLGYSLHKNNAFFSDNVDSLLDVVGGVTLGSFVGDVELSRKKTAGVEKAAMGTAVHFGYAFNDTIEAGIRLEYLSNAVNVAHTAYAETQMTSTAGPQFTLGKGLKLSAQYMLVSTKLTADSSADPAHVGGVSLQAKF